jgi:hypothetical protein
MATTNHQLEKLLDAYPVGVMEIALEARKMIVATMPGLQEMVDGSARVIGYGFGAGYGDLICTIILSKSGVKLGIARSAELPDPNGLLEGAGKVHRYVALAKPSDLRKAGLKQLLKAAVAAWKKSIKDRRLKNQGHLP